MMVMMKHRAAYPRQLSFL